MDRSRLVLARMAVLAAALASLSGCRQIIGVEERSVTGEGGGGAGGAAGTSTGTSTSTGTGSAEVCADYCTTIMQSCKGSDEQYSSQGACLGMCNSMPLGTKGDVEAPTAWCRYEEAIHVSTTSNPAFCPSAGPSGGGSCGKLCEAYCFTVDDICQGAFPGTFLDEINCLEKCAPWQSTKTPYSTAVPDGDTIECRIHHLTLAAEGMAAAECGYALGQIGCVP